MENQKVEKKFTWVIKNFSLQPSIINSDSFVVGGCKWRLVAYPKGNAEGNFPLLLGAIDSETLTCGWRRRAKCRLTIVNQLREVLSIQRESVCLCDDMYPILGFSSNISLASLRAPKGGFLLNDELKIVAEVQTLDVDEEFEEAIKPMENITLVNETIDVNGFQVLPSQVESVKRIFVKHPDMALEVKANNQNLRTAGMNVLLNLIGTLCQSPQELSQDDMLGADSALTYLKDSGFKVDWLEKKLEEVKEKKSGEIRIQELGEKLKGFKKKYSDKEALVEIEKKELKDLELKCEKEKTELKELELKCSFMETLLEEEMAKVLASMASTLTLDDVV